MNELNENLKRIADALDRIAPAPHSTPDWLAHPAYYWGDEGAVALDALEAVALDLLTGIDRQKASLVENTARHAAGYPSHDILLWGSRGMGKSAIVKASVTALQAKGDSIALVQMAASDSALHGLTDLFAALRGIKRQFVLFIDDIGFDDDNSASAARALRSLLEGGAMARPDNIRLYVTSNRRHIVARNMSEQDDPINPRDVVDDRLALADRFGLSLGFHACNQDDYLAIIDGYAERLGLVYDRDDALMWSKQRGNRSGRIAWHYITEIAGRAGKSVRL